MRRTSRRSPNTILIDERRLDGAQNKIVRALRDHVRTVLFFTPWLSIPLALLGIALVVLTPVAVLVPWGWLAIVVAICGAGGLALWLRPRYQLSILDSSPLGVFYWLQRR